MDYIREEPAYYVLAENPSKSSPGKVHEVRKSKADKKVYCTCRGWVVKLNQARAAGKGEAICVHLSNFKKKRAPTAEPVVMMDAQSYELLQRNLVLITNVKSDDGGVNVRRS